MNESAPADEPTGSDTPVEVSYLIVVESEFGNTRKVADAIAEGLGDRVCVLDVDDAPRALPAGLQLLIVGAPTHAFGLSTIATRADAVRQGGRHTGGLRDWLIDVRSKPAIRSVAFDTRQAGMKVFPGSAARRAARMLIKKGLLQVEPPCSFYVTSTSGPLAEGELERARDWGRELSELA